MRKLKIVLQSNRVYFLLILSIILVLLRINFIPHVSKINPYSSFIGVITNINYDGEKYKIHIKNQEEIIGYYKIGDNLNLKLGDKVKVSGKFNELSNNTIPNTFNYKNYLNNHHIFYQISIDKIELISKNKNLIYFIKDKIIERANNFKNKGYIKAFIIGDKTDISIYDTYQDNGVSHLFAISGMHIGLLTSFIYFFFKKSKYQNLIVIIFLYLYLNITNYSASLIRSIIFFLLLIINKKYNLNISTKNILILTVIILITYNPYIIYDYGFIYSAVTTFGLIISTKYYRKNY